jgi:hypothetical protein
MQIEPLGLLTIAVGLIGWLAGLHFLIGALFVSTLLGAAAAINVTALGSANIQPAYLLLGFLVLYAAAQRQLRSEAIAALAFPKEGFWLAVTAAYAVLAAAFLPRIFEGLTYVYTIARTQVGFGLLLTPLVPTTGNVTQTVYFIGDLISFLIFAAVARSPSGLKAVAMAGVICAAVNLLFCALDLITYRTGTTELLGFLRNATYRMLDEAVIGDFKRIVGSFPEASTFAYFTVGLFAYCSKLWLGRVWTYATGPIALLSFIALIFSTSSSGYAGLAAFLAMLFIVSLWQVVTRPVPRVTFALVVLMPVFVVALTVGLRLHTPTWRIASTLLEQTVVDKLGSQSGVERSRWNQQALSNVVDTAGLGGGVGSVRASSFPIAVLGNIGVIGGLLYGVFLAQVLFRHRRGWTDSFPQTCQSAARWACFAQLGAASVAGSFIDLGLPFFIFAGLSVASSKVLVSVPQGSGRRSTRLLNPGVAA